MAKQPNMDVTKLPEWAQHRIQKLENDVKYYTEMMNGTETKSTHIWWEHIEIENHIPDNASVVFDLNTNKVRVRFLEDGLEVYVDGGIRNRIAVLPKSSNVLKIKLVED